MPSAFLMPVEFLRGTYGFVQRVPTGAQKAILTQNLERFRDREVSGPCSVKGGLHQYGIKEDFCL
jgi:hypothetical protein